MKKLIKLSALIIGIGGAVGLGYLISVISNNSADTATGVILVLIALFAGGALVIGAFVYLFLLANDDLKPSKNQPIEKGSADDTVQDTETTKIIDE